MFIFVNIITCHSISSDSFQSNSQHILTDSNQSIKINCFFRRVDEKVDSMKSVIVVVVMGWYEVSIHLSHEFSVVRYTIHHHEPTPLQPSDQLNPTKMMNPYLSINNSLIISLENRYWLVQTNKRIDGRFVCQKVYIETVKLLLSEGADVNKTDIVLILLLLRIIKY
jgi:hypothetical protein